MSVVWSVESLDPRVLDRVQAASFASQIAAMRKPGDMLFRRKISNEYEARVSVSDSDDPNQAVRDASAFLRRHRASLKRIRPLAKECTLSFLLIIPSNDAIGLGVTFDPAFLAQVTEHDCSLDVWAVIGTVRLKLPKRPPSRPPAKSKRPRSRRIP